MNIFTNQAIPKTSDFALTQTACFFVVVDLEIAIKREEHLFSRTRKKKVSNVFNDSTQLIKVAPKIYN